MKPFRKYEVATDWIDKEKFTFETCMSTINLFNVEEWTTCQNEYYGFNDKIERTCLIMNTGAMYKCRVPYKKFDAIMCGFLEEYQLLDEDSTHAKKPNFAAKYSYRGPIDFTFSQTNNVIACSGMPAGFVPKTMEEAIFNSLYTNITPLN